MASRKKASAKKSVSPSEALPEKIPIDPALPDPDEADDPFEGEDPPRVGVTGRSPQIDLEDVVPPGGMTEAVIPSDPVSAAVEDAVRERPAAKRVEPNYAAIPGSRESRRRIRLDTMMGTAEPRRLAQQLEKMAAKLHRNDVRSPAYPAFARAVAELEHKCSLLKTTSDAATRRRSLRSLPLEAMTPAQLAEHFRAVTGNDPPAMAKADMIRDLRHALAMAGRSERTLRS